MRINWGESQSPFVTLVPKLSDGPGGREAEYMSMSKMRNYCQETCRGYNQTKSGCPNSWMRIWHEATKSGVSVAIEWIPPGVGTCKMLNQPSKWILSHKPWNRRNLKIWRKINVKSINAKDQSGLEVSSKLMLHWSMNHDGSMARVVPESGVEQSKHWACRWTAMNFCIGI